MQDVILNDYGEIFNAITRKISAYVEQNTQHAKEKIYYLIDYQSKKENFKSDDLLLIFLTATYVKETGDFSIFDQQTQARSLTGENLDVFELFRKIFTRASHSLIPEDNFTLDTYTFTEIGKEFIKISKITGHYNDALKAVTAINEIYTALNKSCVEEKEIISFSPSLGIQPSYFGLKVEPMLPKSLSEFTYKRVFRNSTYVIHVDNTLASSNTIKHISLDGVPLIGHHILPILNDQQQHSVEVIMG